MMFSIRNLIFLGVGLTLILLGVGLTTFGCGKAPEASRPINGSNVLFDTSKAGARVDITDNITSMTVPPGEYKFGKDGKPGDLVAYGVTMERPVQVQSQVEIDATFSGKSVTAGAPFVAGGVFMQSDTCLVVCQYKVLRYDSATLGRVSLSVYREGSVNEYEFDTSQVLDSIDLGIRIDRNSKTITAFCDRKAFVTLNVGFYPQTGGICANQSTASQEVVRFRNHAVR